MKNRVISLTIILIMALMTVSCTKDDIFGRGSRIRAVVSASSMQTKSGLADQYGRLVGSYALNGSGVDSLCIAVYEFDNSTLPQGLSSDTGLRTKGTVITTAGINRNEQQFTMNAWLESQNRSTADATDYHFMKDALATCDGTNWALTCTSPSDDNWNIWRNKVPTNFWAMYPASLSSGMISLFLPAETASDDEQKTLSFDYTLPGYIPDVYNDAENQQDLCFAYSSKAWDEDIAGNDNTVDIKFYHVLSAVYFDISRVKSTITVNKIGFNNVPSSAHCEITGTPGNPGELKEEDIIWSGQSSLVDYSQAYTSSDFDEDSKVKFYESGKVFMMIPGTLDGTAELWAEFEVDGNPVTKSVNISEDSDGNPVKWKPGKYYLYRLVYNGSGDLKLTGSLGPYATDWWEEY